MTPSRALSLVASPLAAGAATLMILVVAALTGHLNFSRWDNMETFLPAIWYAHSELLHGRFPLWNPFQNLGEPLHAFGIGGALYPPYTLAVALTRLAHWPEARALDLVGVLHATFGAIGLAKLLGELRVRPALAFTAAVSGMLSGYALVVGAMWVHVLPNLAWSVWALWGLRRVSAGERAVSGVVVAIISLAVVFLTGHAQMAVNVWLAVWLWALGLALATRTLRARLRSFALIAVAAALMAAPAVLPTALILSDANRMSGTVSPGHGFTPFAMLGLLAPVIRGSDGALVHTVLITTFLGGWVVPALLLGAAVIMRRRSAADGLQVRVFLVSVAVALVCIWLNFGPRAGLYSAVHSLPVWSHFRIAYKYFERAVPLLVMAAALGLELAARQSLPRRFGLIAVIVALVSVAVWRARPAAEPLAFLAGITAVSATMAVGMRAAVAARLLVPLTLLQSIGLIAITQAPTRSKPYLFDRTAEAALGIADTLSRVLPLSEGPADHPYTRPLALYYAPTLDGYASATGHRFALTALRHQLHFPTTVAGVPRRGGLPLDRLLTSNYLELAAVGHLVVSTADTVALSAVTRAFPAASVTVTPQARVYHLGRDLARAHFAKEQMADAPGAAREILFGAASLQVAVVEGDARHGPLATASVTSLEWGRQRIRAQIRAPQGGLLVFSTSYSREWSARSDGRRTRVAAVDGIFAGVKVPAGATSVELAIRRWPLLTGLALALAGGLLTFLAARSEQRRTRIPS